MFKLNPFFRIRFSPNLVCDLFLEGREFELPSPRYIAFIVEIKGEVSQQELENRAVKAFETKSEVAKEIVSDLIENELLIPAEKTYPEMPGVEHWLKRGWLEALQLHLKTRGLEFVDEASSTPDEVNRELLADRIAKEGPPQLWKSFPGCKSIPLPRDVPIPSDRTFEEVLLSRRSNEPFKRKPLELEVLSSVLQLANREGLELRLATEKNGATDPNYYLNSSFSALETYVIVHSVTTIESGIYHYDLKSHALTLMRIGDFRNDVATLCIGQRSPYYSSCTLLISAIWERYMFRYPHPRAYRSLFVNVGELAQKYLIGATSYRLSQFITPAFEDKFADSLLGTNGYVEAPLYAIALG